MLSGKHHNVEVVPEDGRFATFESYQERYWNSECFVLINEISEACRAASAEAAVAALRWLLHHSALSQDEGAHGVILGASSMVRLSQNLKAAHEGPLPDALVQAYESEWETVSPACIKYFRP